MNELSNRFALVIARVFILQSTLATFALTQTPYRTNCFRAALLHGIKDFALRDHVITSIFTPSQLDCGHACLKNGKCESINYQQPLSTNKIGQQLCELNNATSLTHPQHLVLREGFFYYDNLLPPPCESSPCQNYGSCFSKCGSYDYQCICYGSWSGKRCHLQMKSCKDWLRQGFTENREYAINPDGLGEFYVYCDQVTSGGGWIVFQRRQDGSVSFDRAWPDFKNGFGTIRELWLGNKYIYRLTRSRTQLRIDLKDFNRNSAYALYSSFNISSESDNYRLFVAGYSGTAGDSLALPSMVNNNYVHNRQKFTTKDVDNDLDSNSNCAVGSGGGGWWYSYCYDANLNGAYKTPSDNTAGIVWWQWKHSYENLQFTEMKLREI